MGMWNQGGESQGVMSMGGGDVEPIPNGTQVKVAMDEIKWDSYEGDDYIKARWCVIDGDYKNRKIFQKIRVRDQSVKKREKAEKMLVAIDFNAGGQLQKMAMASTTEGEWYPTDQELAGALLNKPMVLKLGVWKIDDDPSDIKKGNWVQAVSPLNSKPAHQVTPIATPKATPNVDDLDDVPF